MALYVPTYGARFAAFTLYGLGQLRVSVVYVWMTELVKSDHATAVNSCITVFDVSTLGVTCFYFLFVSRDMRALLLFMSVMATISLVLCVLVLPESPAWLISASRKKEAIKSFNIIAWFNQSEIRIPESATFEEEAQYGNQDQNQPQENANISSVYMGHNLSWIAN